MRNNFKTFIKEFFFRGLFAMGFGPLVMAVVFFFLDLFNVIETISVSSVVLGVFTVSLLAFIVSGMTVIYQVESLPLASQILIHALVLYLTYAAVYLINGWLSSDIIAFGVFSACFVLGFALIWLIVYLCTRKSTEKLNENLKNTENL